MHFQPQYDLSCVPRIRRRSQPKTTSRCVISTGLIGSGQKSKISTRGR
jgi:hypothetical protein